MATITLTEATAQLQTVNTAISNLIDGKRLTILQVGSGTFKRTYTYQEITMEALKEHRDELIAVINSLSPETPKFNLNMHIPLIVRK